MRTINTDTPNPAKVAPVRERAASAPLVATITAGADIAGKSTGEILQMSQAAKGAAVQPVIDLYRSLCDREQERTFNFMQDGEIRQANPAYDAKYTAVEEFDVAMKWLRRGMPVREIRETFGLSENQWDRYMKAYAIIASVAEEVAGVDSLAVAG